MLSIFQKQLILLKLTDAFENLPDFGEEPINDPKSPPMLWLARVGVLLKKTDIVAGINFNSARSGMFRRNRWTLELRTALTIVSNIIEGLKLDIELEGRDEIGNVYRAGSEFDFFKDIRRILSLAKRDVFVIDPYFGEGAFGDCFSDFQGQYKIQILSQGGQAKQIQPFISKHQQQFSSQIQLRTSKKTHDRVIFIDGTDGWITGGSINEGGKKPSYIMPIHPQLAAEKLSYYKELWDKASVII